MKKFFMIAVLFVFMLCAGCAASQTDGTQPSLDQTTAPSNPTSPTDPSDPDDPIDPQVFPEYVPGSIVLEDRTQDDYSFMRKYRIAYYRIWGEYMDLLDDEQREDMDIWLEQVSDATNHGEVQEEMLLVSFVKRYNISREAFDAATTLLAEHCECDTHLEECEVPNGEIIYSFNNEIINYYYRYE